MLGLLPEASAYGLAEVSVAVVAAVLQAGLALTTLVVNGITPPPSSIAKKQTTTMVCRNTLMLLCCCLGSVFF